MSDAEQLASDLSLLQENFDLLQKESENLRAQLAAANKRIDDAEKQEPVEFNVECDMCYGSGIENACEGCGNCNGTGFVQKKLFTAPIPSPDVDKWMAAAADLGRCFDSANKRIAELERKLEEQQSQNSFDAKRLRRLTAFCGVAAPESDEELLQVAGVVIGSCLRVLESAPREQALDELTTESQRIGMYDAKQLGD